jgi:hypothetical protein
MSKNLPALPSLIPYFNSSVPSIYNVEGALDYLMYTPITQTITVYPAVEEIGSTVTDVDLSWTISREPEASVSVTDVFNIDKSLLSNSISLSDLSLTTNKTYTITVNDFPQITTASVTLFFRYSNYWGSSTSVLTDEDILYLSYDSLSGTKNGDYEFENLTNEYIYMAFPTSYGTPVFTVNGLIVIFESTLINNFTNSSGATTSYTLYKSQNLLNGSVLITVS